MTIWYPDVSNHEGAMPLEAGTVAVIAKATEGTGYADPFCAHYKAEAARVGAVFGGYHFLHAGNGAGQARFCFQHVGAGIPVMIDLEPTSGSNPSVQDGIDFAREFRALGGICSLVYLPRWYWQQLGSPSLVPLCGAQTGMGLGLVSSNYTAYSDTGPGWASYGGILPSVWQYTDALAYSGQSVDFNAYRGTVEQFKALLGIAPHPAPTPAPPAPPTPLEEVMQIEIWRCNTDPRIYAVHESGKMLHVDNVTSLESILAAKPVEYTVNAQTMANLKAALGYTGA